MIDREMRVIAALADKVNVQYFHEDALLAATKEMLDMLGARYVRVITATETGIADLLICYQGHFVACELKTRTGKPTTAQREFLHDIIKSGGKAAVCRTLREVLKLLIE